jgi:hypothetical protein
MNCDFSKTLNISSCYVFVLKGWIKHSKIFLEFYGDSMANIMQMRYEPSVMGRIATEEELLILFDDLRKLYESFSEKHAMADSNDNSVDNLKQFLEMATRSQKVIIKGATISSSIPVEIEYDFSKVHGITREWDLLRDHGCHSCMHHRNREYEEYCRQFRPGTDCPKYSAQRVNLAGEPAATLAELIESASGGIQNVRNG